MTPFRLSVANPAAVPRNKRETSLAPAPHAHFGCRTPALESPESGPECEVLDQGRLLVHRPFAKLFHERQWTTFSRIFELDGGSVVRRIGSRETRRIVLEGGDGTLALFLKRHDTPRWRDRILPWLHGARPIHGARNEWEAIHAFIAAGLPTMTPVAFGECEGRSLLITRALPAKVNLLEWIGGRGTAPARPVDNTPAGAESQLRPLTAIVAGITQRMHTAGWHHQDFYLNHLLLCDAAKGPDIRVIDLGRARRLGRWPGRWILKDLAQLNFSAGRISVRERLRFLRLYLGRRFDRDDRRLVRQIAAKSRRIAAHTEKHDL